MLYAFKLLTKKNYSKYNRLNIGKKPKRRNEGHWSTGGSNPIKT